MKLIKYSIISLFTLVSTGTFAQSGGAVVVTPEVVPGEYIVKYKNRAATGVAGKIHAKFSGQARSRAAISELNIHHVKVSNRKSHEQNLKDLKDDPDIEYAEPNYVLKLHQTGVPLQIMSANEIQSVVSASSASYAQSSAPVQVSQAWGHITQSQTPAVVVAVVDTGVDYSHSIFTNSNSIWNNSAEVASNGVDDDGNGYVDDVRGWNFISNSNNPMDDNGHGTHAAGVVIGLGQNIFANSLSTSIIQVMPLKFMDSTGSGTTSNAISAIYYAINNGARVINNSWGGPGYSQALHDALTFAYNHGVFIASAAGNYGTNNDASPLYPASLPIPSQMSVAATDNLDHLASFSSYGPSSVHLAAPGVTVLSTYLSQQFAYMSGTSMATPFVAGVAALLFHENQNMTGYQVKQLMLKNSDTVSGLQMKVASSGRVNVLNSVLSTSTTVGVTATQPSYIARTPAGENTGSSSSAGGCGTVGLVTIQAKNFFGGGGGSGGSHLGFFTLFIVLMTLPMVTWFIVKSKMVSRPRRAHDRFVLHSEVKVKVEGRELVGRLNTIGVGGASFDADAMLAKGGAVSMKICGPDGKDQIEVVGRVVWNESNHSYGVQFAQVKESIVDRIRFWSADLVKT
jgi:subtilisin family serine protease